MINKNKINVPVFAEICSLKENLEIKNLLINRFKELKLSQIRIINDARSHGIKLSTPNFNRYLKGRKGRSIVSSEQIYWLCKRYGINVEINVSIKVSKVKNYIFTGYKD